jgi:3-phosphoshikimate 1-carboxyvinyltransferase
VRIDPAARITGHVAVPGDKSISHRSLLIGALSPGETRVHGFGRGGDTESTASSSSTAPTSAAPSSTVGTPGR